MEKLLGVQVPDDTRGCLQDIDWSCRPLVFRRILLGAMMAAQLAHYCHQDIPSMEKMIKEGIFDDIREQESACVWEAVQVIRRLAVGRG